MQDLLDFIKNLYGLSQKVTVLKEVTQGVLSTNFIIGNNSQKFFLKRYRFTNPSEVKNIHEVKRYFSKEGIPVILPIVNGAGESFFLFNDGIYALFPFIEAKQLDKDQLSKTAIKSLAETLSKIHLIGKDGVFLKEPVAFKDWDNGKFLKTAQEIQEIIMNKKEKDSFDELALQTLQLKRNIVQKNTKQLKDFEFGENHLIHGDYHIQNIFFDENDRVIHVFDFEKADVAPRIYEVLRSMDYIFFRGKPTKKDLEKAALYFGIYNKLYPFTQKEIEDGVDAYYLKKSYGLWVVSEHYLNNNFRPDIFLKEDFENLKYFSSHTDTLKRVLQSMSNI